MIFGEIGGHDAPGPSIDDRLLVERKGYAPDHAAVILAADQARIDHAAGREGTDETRRADLAEIRIDLDLSEDRPVRMHGVSRLRRRVGGARAAALDFGEAGPLPEVGVALAPAFVVSTEE